MEILIGSLLCAAGGLGIGIFLLPLKFSKTWKWENSWLAAALLMYVIFPVISIILLIPQAMEIYSRTPAHDLFMIYLFGLIQGTGALVFTYGATLLGLSLGYALITGTIAAIAILIPLFGAHSDRLSSLDGITLLIGCAILLVGIVFSGKAGVLRERQKSENKQSAKKLNFWLVAFIVGWAGIANSLWYFTFEFQQGMKAVAIDKYGVNDYLWGFLNVVPFFFGMFTTNLLIMLGKMIRDGSLKNYWAARGLGREYALAALIGLVWYLGQGIGYTVGFNLLGPLGVAVGAALFMGTMIVASNIAGVRTGEWKGVKADTTRALYIGLFLLVLAMIVIAVGNYMQQKVRG